MPAKSPLWQLLIVGSGYMAEADGSSSSSGSVVEKEEEEERGVEEVSEGQGRTA
jgi:hypothetical protein